MKTGIKKIIVFGPIGSGKGTQAEIIAEYFNIPKIATGEIFRDNIIRETQLGKEAKKFYDLGKLVPDGLTNQLVESRLKEKDCQKGFILDGFPRNLIQARALEKFADLDLALEIWISDKEAFFRITERRVCQNGHVYHLKFNPPKVNLLCDKCGQKLFIREDDKPEIVKSRLKIYHQETEQLLDFYREKGILMKINGEQPIPDVTKEIFNKIEKKSL